MFRSLLIVALLTPSAALAETPAAKPSKPKAHPFGVEDMVDMQRISTAEMSPDGKSVVYALRTTDLEANRGRTDLWVVGSKNGAMRQLTSDPENETDPAWAPDGKSVYFLAARGKAQSMQVWQIPIDGGEATRVTDLPVDVNAFLISPDGKRLAVALDVWPDCNDLDCTVKKNEADENKDGSGRLYKKLMVRHWDEWEDGRRSHWFTLPVAGGKPVDLMKGMDADSPSKPFGDAGEASFTPDGQSLVFASKDAGREEAWSTNFDLYLASVDGTGKPKNLTKDNPGTDTHPVFSPDGKTLAYLSMARGKYEADRYRIMTMAWPDGKATELAPSWDRSPDDLVWADDGKKLYAAADDLGQHPLFAIDLAGKVTKMVSEGTVTEIAPGADDVIVYGLDHLRSPVELFVIDPARQKEHSKPNYWEAQQLTNHNGKRLAKIVFGEPQQFSFKGANDDTVYGWVVKPAGFDKSKKYPVAFLIHGGPQGSFGNHFHYRWNPQAYAGHGYAVVMIDFHGSTGYGQKFTDDINQDWGGKPFEDLQKGLENALDRFKFLDGKNVCALGGSYGGYMINWIAGKWPDRFKCLVAHDGNLDERAAYFDTEELWFPEWDHGGTPWDNPESYAKHNPIDLVKNWKTPMLFIHGAKDFRVVETQGLMSFNAAQRRGVPSELLYFPDENHWVLKPKNSIQWYETVLGWLDRWTRKK
jgi:dipeptidyl aminopeptidase/acylaminoacyl peptidase